MIESEPILDQLSVRSGQLYSLPGVAMQVLQLTQDPHVDTKALKDCIENDPAIASRILRVVNSSLFGLSREVSDLGQALAMLGITPLKLLVLGFSLPSGLFLDVESKTLLWYWKHALTKAVAGRELSHRLWRIPGDEAFLAGLFQDLGALLLFQQLGQPYVRFLDRAVGHHLDLCAIEQRALGFPHTELSARLLRQWKLPESLCEAVAWQPSEGASRSALTQILHLSELFARLFADGQTSALAELLATARGYCQHLDQQLEPLVAEVEIKVNELADIFSLALPDGLEYRDLLAEAHRQMAHVATQAAEGLVRSRLPEREDVDEDWILSELDSLSDALAAVCASPVESAPKSPAADRPAPARSIGYAVAVQRPTAQPARSTVAAPNLLDRLTGVVAACRSSRRPLSLLLVKLSAGEELLANCGQQELATVRRVLGKVCARLDHPGTISLPHTEFGFALILPGAERTEAVELGNDLIRAVRNLAVSAGVLQQDSLKLDIGVASSAQLPKNFPPRDLLEGADRCLYASHVSGGGVVKSIEIY
jgi:HD-like signal output (HDOD) protein/GGDEF domain-containing protein